MSQFSRPNYSKPSFGKKPFGRNGGFGHGKKEMHQAQCATCGKACEVPFRPNGRKPVYCSDCFVKDDSNRSPRNDFAPRQQFNNNHNDRPAPRPDQAFNDLKAELRLVNQNLERLIGIMTPVAKVEKAPKTEKASKKKTAKK